MAQMKSKKELTRSEKINLLNQIKKGRITPEALQEPILYSVILGLEKEGKYSVSEDRPNPNPTKYLTPEEFEEWKNKIEELNKTRVKPHKINLVIFRLVDDEQ
jgi:hypothetical protein